MTDGIESVGYEGRMVDDLLTALRRAGVHTVADVRLNAVRRKPGFSKARLRESLAAAGMPGIRPLR